MSRETNRRKRQGVMFAEKMDRQNSLILVAMEIYEDEITPESQIATNYVGEVGADDEIPADVKQAFPQQFRRRLR